MLPPSTALAGPVVGESSKLLVAVAAFRALVPAVMAPRMDFRSRGFLMISV
jgi:hypothetical protein